MSQLEETLKSIDAELRQGAEYTKLSSRYWTPARALFLLLAVLLIVFGFAINGISEPGHHLGLIVGGIACGWGLKR